MLNPGRCLLGGSWRHNIPRLVWARFSTRTMKPGEQIEAKVPSERKEKEINNEPINFFGSQAAVWKAKSTRSGGADDNLWYQPYVISASLAVFLIYFCILREENDIDVKLDKSLYEHVDGLEQVQLTTNYKYNREHNLDVTEIEKRLQELGVDVSQL